MRGYTDIQGINQWKIYTLGVMYVLATVSCLERPEQVHISYGDTPDQMVVLWSTLEDVKRVVQYGENQNRLTEQQNSEKFHLTSQSWNGRQFMHRAIFKNLKLNTTYFYLVTSTENNNSTTLLLYDDGYTDHSYFYQMPNSPPI